jgi:hypothetical protein
MAQRRSSKPSACPKCGSISIVRILYGLPSPEAVEEAKQGKFALGGCCVTDHDPQWHCNACEHEWRREVAGRP